MTADFRVPAVIGIGYSAASPVAVYYDPTTKQLSANGVVVPTGGNSVGLSGVTYDTNNRVTGYTLNGVSYTVAGWGTSSVTITGSDGSLRTISFDGSGRISGVA